MAAGCSCNKNQKQRQRNTDNMLNLDANKKNQSPIMQPLPSFQVRNTERSDAAASARRITITITSAITPAKATTSKSSVPVDIQRFLVVFVAVVVVIVVVWAKKYCAFLIVLLFENRTLINQTQTHACTYTHTHLHKYVYYVFIVTYGKAMYSREHYRRKPSPKTAATHFTFSKRGTAQRQLRKTKCSKTTH